MNIETFPEDGILHAINQAAYKLQEQGFVPKIVDLTEEEYALLRDEFRNPEAREAPELGKLYVPSIELDLPIRVNGSFTMERLNNQLQRTIMSAGGDLPPGVH